MARARNIKPGIMENEDLADLSHAHRLLFIYLWMLADREGRLEDRPKRIKAQAFPYDDGMDVDAMLNDLQKAGFLFRYVADEKPTIQIAKFTKHQTPHVREQASSLPEYVPVSAEIEPCQEEELPRHNLGSDTASPGSPDSLILISSDSLIPDSNQEPCAPSAHDEGRAEDLFASFWKLYPRKTDKAKAQKAWAKLNPDRPLFEKIMRGLGNHCASRDWIKDDGQFIPHPTTWLNGKRWEDEVRPAGTIHQFPGQSRHTGFDQRDYTAGLTQREDGTYAF